MQISIRGLHVFVSVTLAAGLISTSAAELPQGSGRNEEKFLVVPPANIGKYWLAETSDLSDAPGGGYSFRYMDEQQVVVDVFVYAVIPAEGYRSAGETTQKAVDFEVTVTKLMLDIQVGKGVLKKWSRVSEGVEVATIGTIKVPGHFLTIEQERSGVLEDSFFRIYVIEGHFIKLRVTEPHGIRSTEDISIFASNLFTTMLIVRQ